MPLPQAQKSTTYVCLGISSFHIQIYLFMAPLLGYGSDAEVTSIINASMQVLHNFRMIYDAFECAGAIAIYICCTYFACVIYNRFLIW
jgi:hypothetical protein